MKIAGLSSIILAAMAPFVATCAQVDLPTNDPVLPGDYKQTFVQVLGCRSSVEHDLANVVVRTRAEVAPVYAAGPYPFAAGTLIVKEQYADARCVQLTGYTAMLKQKSGDWEWFSLDPRGDPLERGKIDRCLSCHASCKARDGACADLGP